MKMLLPSTQCNRAGTDKSCLLLCTGKANEALLRNNEAKADFEKAIVFSPKYTDAYVRLGAVCNKLGQYKEALVYLNHATGIDKRNKTAYPEKVTTLLELEKYDQALKSSDTALILIKMTEDLLPAGTHLFKTE